MDSKSSTKKGKTALGENQSEDSPSRIHEHTLDVDSHPDTAIVGSSRRRRVSSASKDTMGRSTSPGEVNRTRTGRVSKAAKGQPVHHCHCGKTYTRAEHLRRHQQNHKPGAFPCDVPGCERAFCREDLLTRHKLKHDEPLESTDYLVSQDLVRDYDLSALPPSPPALYQSEADLQEVAPVLELGVYEVDSRTSQQQSETGTRKDYIPIAELQPPAIGLAFDHGPVGYDRQSSLSLDLSPSYSFGSAYNTPEPGYQTYGQSNATSIFDVAQSWVTHPPSLYASYSPASRNSTTPTPLGRRPSVMCTQLRTPNSEVSQCDTRNHASFSSDPYLGDASVIDITKIPELRDMLEQEELVTPTSIPQTANFGPNQYRHRPDNEQRYLEAFWRSVHPAWPVFHKPTFDPTRASPLLRAAMVTLGAHATGIPIDSANACILHKRCLRVIQKRTIDQSHSYRMEDMQAIYFVELFAIARSRRPPLQSSKPFVDTYHNLAREYNTDTTNTMFATIESSFNSPYGTPANICPLEVEKTRRLLTACYILDTQHSTFFGREATQIPDFNPATLSLPQPLQSWDMPSSPAFYGETPYEHFVPQLLLPQATMGVQPSNEPLDIFTSMLLLAYAHKESTSLRPEHCSAQRHTPTPTLASQSPSPHIQLAQQSFALSTLVPVRALLAVAGDSWILDGKLGSRAEFAKAQADVREWATTNTAAALPFAIEIIRLHKLHTKTTFLFHEWSLHLAVLVVWAKMYADKGTKRQQLRLEVPASCKPGMSAGQELDGLILGLVNNNAGAGVTWEDTIRLLTWAKGRTEKGGIARFCGVVSGAVNVLTALVERGIEDGWF
jgi:hypothetical protein